MPQTLPGGLVAYTCADWGARPPKHVLNDTTPADMVVHHMDYPNRMPLADHSAAVRSRSHGNAKTITWIATDGPIRGSISPSRSTAFASKAVTGHWRHCSRVTAFAARTPPIPESTTTIRGALNTRAPTICQACRSLSGVRASSFTRQSAFVQARYVDYQRAPRYRLRHRLLRRLAGGAAAALSRRVPRGRPSFCSGEPAVPCRRLGRRKMR